MMKAIELRQKTNETLTKNSKTLIDCIERELAKEQNRYILNYRTSLAFDPSLLRAEYEGRGFRISFNGSMGADYWINLSWDEKKEKEENNFPWELCIVIAGLFFACGLITGSFITFISH